MKAKILGIIALMLAMVMVFTSCGLIDNVVGFFTGGFINNVVDFFTGIFSPAIELTDKPLETEKLIDFKDGANPDVLFESDGWSNGDVFNVVWKSHNVHYENGIMRLGIKEEAASAWLDGQDVAFNYTAGEARTQNYYHYGDYEVSMKPSANPGTASTFFICTGPYDLKDGNPNPHDEIDIEFLGSDTTHVQFNFFVDGKGGNEYMYDLGFDASEEFHTYGFRWEESSITWFVDGKPVYKVTTDASVETASNVKIVEKLPSTAGRILSNYWCGNERAWGWMGKYVGETKDNGTQYQWIATSAEGAPLNPPVVNPPVEGEDAEINWEEINPIAPEFPSAAPYEVAVEGNKATVTYTDVSGSAYMPIELDVTDAVAGKNYVYLKVTNNGAETVNVRVNMFDPTLTGNNKATNISATMNGEAVRTDLDWGGSFFDIAAGETAELVVCFGVGGVKLQLMIDSSRNDSVLRSGNVTVEDIKFAAVGEVEVPHKCEDADEDGKCDGCGENMPAPPEPTPEDPTSGNLTTTINGAEVTFQGNVTDGYGVNAENGTLTVEYTNIVGNSYKNFWATVSDIAGTRNIFSMKVINNGTESVKVRIDIESQTQVTSNTTCCNLSATQNGAEAFTDLEWGGSTFVIESGVTAILEVVYDASKTPTNLKIFVDSCQWDDESAHAGNVTISDMEFKGEYTPVEPDPNHKCESICEECGKCLNAACGEAACSDKCQGHSELPPVDEELQLDAFWVSSNEYTTSGTGPVNIKYNGAGNTYQCVGTSISAHAAGKTTFTVTITNNGAADSRVRVDIQGTTQIGNHTVINTGATGGDVWTDSEWGGSTVTVPAGQSVTLVITYDENTDRGAVTNLVVFVDAGRGDGETYNSDITLSDMSFSGESAPVVPPHECESICAECGKCLNGECEDAACSDKCQGHEEIPEVDPIINISDLAVGKTVAGAELVEGTGIYTTSALDIDENKKSIDDFAFTLRLKLGGTMKVSGDEVSKAVKIVAKDASKVVVYAIASSKDAAGRTLLLATVESGAFVAVAETVEVGGTAVAKYELSIPAAGTYYLGSTDSGINLYYIAVVDGTAEPVHECESPCDQCGKCTNVACEEAACSDKCQGHYVFETGEYLNYSGNDCYTFDSVSYLESINITYANVSTNTYQNINAWIKDKAEGHSTLKLYIVNNGAETVSITVKLEAAGSGLAETKATVEAGQISEVVLDFVGAPELLYLFIDSGWSEETTTHAGDMTIRGVRFVGEAGSGDVIIPVTGEYLNYQGNDCYTFDNESYLESINVTYTSVNTNTWQNINTWVQDKAAGKSVLKLYIKNNGEEAVKVTVKLEVSGAGVGETKVQAEAGQMIEVELEYAGEADLIFFFIDSDWSEETTTHAGDITISGVRFE